MSSTASRLEAIPGLGNAKRLVGRLGDESAGAHGVLLYGSAGSGRDRLARELARIWLAKSDSEDDRAALAFDRGANPDYLEIRPAGPSSIIALAAIRTDPQDDEDRLPMDQFLRTMPLYSRHKVVLIANAHRMNGRAANALLKSLEEPPEYGKLILSVESVGQILPTILSRCVAVACEVPPADELLARYPTATAEDLTLANGEPDRLAAIAENPEPYRLIAAWVADLPRSGASDMPRMAERFFSITDALRDKETPARTTNASALESLAIALRAHPNIPSEWTHRAIEAHRRTIGNGNYQLVVEALVAGFLAGRRG